MRCSRRSEEKDEARAQKKRGEEKREVESDSQSRNDNPAQKGTADYRNTQHATSSRRLPHSRIARKVRLFLLLLCRLVSRFLPPSM